MKRLSALTALLATLGLAAHPAAALYPTPTKLHVATYALHPMLRGSTDSGQLLDLAVKAPEGTVKAVARTTADSAGSFEFELPQSQSGSSLAAGDTVELVLGENPAWKYTAVVPRLFATGFDLAAGTLSGRVLPPQEKVELTIDGDRVVPADPATVADRITVGWASPPGGSVPAADGSFSFTPVMAGGTFSGPIQRNDAFFMRATSRLVSGDDNFTFTTSTQGALPGVFATVLNRPLVRFSGLFGRLYRAALLSRTGTVKGTAVGTPTVYQRGGYFLLRSGSGRLAPTRPGDVLRVRGPGGFSARVPRLRARIDTAANSAVLLGPREAFVQASFTLFDDFGERIFPGPDAVWVRTDGSGLASVAPPAPFVLRQGDVVKLQTSDPAGHTWTARFQALPAAP